MYRIDAAHVREPEVHESDIGLVFTKTLDRFARVGSLRNHLHVRLAIDDGGNPFAHQRMVINTEDAYLVCDNFVVLFIANRLFPNCVSAFSHRSSIHKAV